MIGKVLGNRYEIVEKIGGGGMSVVYKARCRVLNRYVAIKILRNELISDSDFVEKFKQESLSAASLNHPNIVNIYDTGMEDDIYYIVMENIKGVTLKDYITKNGKLSEEETIKISMQVAEALKHAHANKIIHRDIKPHNIMITDEGIVKVADFGIAKAASSSTINNASNVIGSVHYFSPEQARGGYVDEKSDIYSLGVVMYEMVTGVVPFDADNHISVAMKHIKESALPPTQRFNDISISKGLEAIILKCMEKHQSYRYQKASDLLKDLFMLQKNSSHEPEVQDRYLDNENSPTIIMPKIDTDMIEDNSSDNNNSSMENNNIINENDNDDKIENSKAFEEFFAGDKDDNATNGTGKKVTTIILSEKEEKTSKKKKNKKDDDNAVNGKEKDNFKTTFAAIMSALVLVTIIGFFVIKSMLIVPEVVVPALVGQTEEEARKLASESGIILNVKDRVFDSEYAEGVVCKQSVEAEQKVKKGYPVEILISKGTKEIEVPNLIGEYSIAVKSILKNKGLEEGEIKTENSDKPSGMVIRQSPEAGEKVQMGAKVDYVYSEGPKIVHVKVPTLVGLSLEAAKAKIAEEKLNVGDVSYDYSDEIEKGLVMKQTYRAGDEVEELTRIGLVVSLGKNETTPTNPGDNNGNGDGNGTGTNPNEEDDETKYSQISVPLPEGKDKVKISVYKITESGKELVYENEVEIKNGEKSILITVSGKGTQNFEVYVDGESIGTIPVSFE